MQEDAKRKALRQNSGKFTKDVERTSWWIRPEWRKARTSL